MSDLGWKLLSASTEDLLASSKYLFQECISDLLASLSLPSPRRIESRPTPLNPDLTTPFFPYDPLFVLS